jgi:hypothetical protein
MRVSGIAVAGLALAAMALGGCRTVTNLAVMPLLRAVDEDPFDLPVEAAALTPLAAGTGAIVAPPGVPDVPVTEPAMAAPERTNIRGAGDGSMEVDVVTVRAEDEGVPHRIANFSREQVAMMVCASRRAPPEQRRDSLAAWRATVAAYEANEANLAGRMSTRDFARVERARQDAVNRIRGRGMADFLFGTRSSKDDLPQPRTADGLVLENVDLFFFSEAGREAMAVSGVVRNTGAAQALVPPVTLEAIDEWDFILAGQSSLLPFERLEAGEARAFEARFLNPPDTTAEVYAHFAPPFEYRAGRDCDGFDPAMFNPGAEPAPEAEPVGPTHTAGELSRITRIYRNRAEEAWPCRLGAASPPPRGGVDFESHGSGERREGFSIAISAGRPDMARLCGPATLQPGWRQWFELAEAADEAWGATVAGADVEAAAGRLRALADASVRLDEAAPGVVADVSAGRFTYEGFEVGLHVSFEGVLKNTSDQPRRVGQLMVALVDRLGLPLWSTRVVIEPVELAPGASAPISERVQLANEPVGRGGAHEAPEWKLRVGALGR